MFTNLANSFDLTHVLPEENYKGLCHYINLLIDGAKGLCMIVNHLLVLRVSVKDINPS